ncbi:MAG: hypothetical protein M3O55_07000, partial [Actinomycetota bacterium]|nr:hypothetical protein [Actinomycetota bacterium]
VIAIATLINAAGGSDPQARSSTGPSPKVAAPGTSSAAPPSRSPRGTPSAAPGVPAGFVTYRDPVNGFSVAVPAGWQRTSHVGSASDGQLDFRDPNSGRFLRFGYTTHPKDDPVADWQQQERKLQSRAGYRRLSIQAVSYNGWPTADWEFLLGSTHVRDRGFKVDSSHGYAIYLSSPDSAWSDGLRYFDVAAGTFKPAG